MSWIPYIIQNQHERNTRYQMLVLGATIPSLPPTLKSIIDIRSLFPYWILDRNESDQTDSYFVDFIQSYYDWLYTESGYELNFTDLHSIGLLKLVDIDETPLTFLSNFSYSYASGISSWFIGDSSDDSSEETQETQTVDVRELIKGIRQNLYQKKSNEEAYKYFFQSLFNINATDIVINYPKLSIMRLNGGRFKDERWGTEDSSGYYGDLPHLGGSFLNSGAKIQDSFWYQNFSYLLKVGIEDIIEDSTGLPYYYNDLQSILHPAGIKGFFEKTTQDYIPPDDYDGGILQGEEPRLHNYFPYRLSDTMGYTACIGCSGSGFGYDGPTAHAGSTPLVENGDGTYTFGVFGGSSGGWTSGGAWGGVGGGGISAGFNAPCHHFPDWDNDIDMGVMFGNINIREFIYLYPALESPNLGLTGCTASGGTGACY